MTAEKVAALHKTAEQGNADSQFFLGFLYTKGYGVEQDSTQVLYWWQKAAEQGLAQAQFSLGNCYANGIYIGEDYAKAEYWYRKAAEQGYVLAKNELRKHNLTE